MEEHKPNNRNRNTALFLIGAGIYLLLQNMLGGFFVVATILIGLGVYITSVARNKKGTLLVVLGVLLLLIHDMAILVSILFILGGFFYYQSKKAVDTGCQERKHTLAGSIRWDKEPFVLRDTSIWFAFGEARMDLSLAILEQPETTVLLQGIIGDVDIIVPEYIGLSVEASVLFGPLDIHLQREHGVMNRVQWRSPNYEQAHNKVRLIVSYAVGDIDVKIM